jgi:hypothetical protein
MCVCCKPVAEGGAGVDLRMLRGAGKRSIIWVRGPGRDSSALAQPKLPDARPRGGPLSHPRRNAATRVLQPLLQSKVPLTEKRKGGRGGGQRRPPPAAGTPFLPWWIGRAEFEDMVPLQLPWHPPFVLLNTYVHKGGELQATAGGTGAEVACACGGQQAAHSAIWYVCKCKGRGTSVRGTGCTGFGRTDRQIRK